MYTIYIYIYIHTHTHSGIHLLLVLLLVFFFLSFLLVVASSSGLRQAPRHRSGGRPRPHVDRRGGAQGAPANDHDIHDDNTNANKETISSKLIPIVIMMVIIITVINQQT